MTDHHTDELFENSVTSGGLLFVNRFSRLVFDPECFPDDAVELASVGMEVQTFIIVMNQTKIKIFQFQISLFNVKKTGLRITT